MTVYKRHNGKRVTSRHPDYERATWYAWFRIDGKAYNRSLKARTEKQARHEERELIDRIISGETKDRGFSDFVDDVYARYIRQLRSRATQELFIPELKAFFKDKPLSRITPQHCRDYRNRRLATPTKNGTRSNGSLNREMAALSKILSLAVEEGCIRDNPVRRVKRLRENDPRHRTLTETQFQALFRELAKDPLVMDLVIIALHCPLRKAQITAIQAKHVDIENRVLWAVGSKGKPPRAVFLHDAPLEVLRRRCALYDGDLFPVKRFEKRWKRILIAAGINKENGSREGNFHFHDLRSQLATRLAQNGVPVHSISKLFNHSSVKVTDIYLVPDEKQFREVMEGLNYDIIT